MISARLLVETALVLVALQLAPAASTAQERVGASPAPPSAVPKAPYLQRGDEVDARYRSYRELLERFFETFEAQLKQEAPDLLAKSPAAPPRPVPYGYQILPKLLPDPPLTSGASRVPPVSYSWARTDGFIQKDLGRLATLETRVAQAARMPSEDRRKEWEKMLGEYQALAANQKLIAAHLQYNRLWQSEIARYRSIYDLNTALHDAALQRQAFLDTLQAGDQVLEPYLRAREEALSRQIHEATDRIVPPDFLRVEHLVPHRWILRVPVYTDIEDRSFVAAFQSAVENAWHVEDGEDDFRVELDIRHVPASQLYPDGGRPAHGEHIDVAQHIGRFPPGGVVLTTGANLTYVRIRGIIVGPHAIASKVLAHEFGHMLGFVDRYFRGYRDRGPEGFEVLEVVIDPEDIMSGGGRVGRHHFERILSARLESSREDVTMKAGLEALDTRRDPEEAAAQFRKLLEWNPNHYGATFQLARALDQGGKRGEARPWWEKALKMAEASHDKATAAAARARLAEQP